jgi:hypothetical protein
LAKNPLREREGFGIMRVALKRIRGVSRIGGVKIPREVSKETAQEVITASLQQRRF